MLRELGLLIVPLATCQATYGNQLVDNGLEIDGQICAGFEGRATNKFPGTFKKVKKNRLVLQEKFLAGDSIIPCPFCVKKYFHHEKFKPIFKNMSQFLNVLLKFKLINC